MRTYPRPGVEPLGSGQRTTHGIAGAEFHEAVDEKMKTGMAKPDAIKAVVKSNPELHAAYIQEHNAKVGPSSFRGSQLS
jgi:hypothetical protein